MVLRDALGRVPTLVVDVALALVFVAVNSVEVLTRFDDGISAGSPVANLVVLGVFSLFLVLRRRSPMLCWSLMHGEFLLSGLVVAHSGFAFGTSLPACIATYTVARYADRRWVPWALLSGPAIWGGVLLADGWNTKLVGGAGFFVASTLAAWGTGRLLRRLSERDQELERARDRLPTERTLREEAAVRAERARIALDLHDVVTQAVSGMVDRLGSEARTLASSGDDVSRLELAHQAGQQALAELRRTMEVLRPQGEGVGRLPSLADTDGLVQRLRDAGLQVTYEAEDLPAVPQGLSFAAYRILQEALTNALKHGDRRTVLLVVGHDGDSLVLEVRNRRAVSPGAGEHPSGRHGLVGMRERVTAFGGSLNAGADGADFVVRAVLPASLRTRV